MGELATNKQTRSEKTDAVELLHAEIDALTASIAKLTEDMKNLNQDIAFLTDAMAKATKIRSEEKSKNAETISDAKAGQTAVSQAITVLKEFYAKAGEATAFAQGSQPAPEIFDGAYKGMQSENGGVVGMLEVIESDFARLETETTNAENEQRKEYDMLMVDSKVDKDQKTTTLEHKASNKQDDEQSLVSRKKDLQGTQGELDAALAYFDKLKPSCIDTGVKYDDRVSQRQEEIQSLREALKILKGEDL